MTCRLVNSAFGHSPHHDGAEPDPQRRARVRGEHAALDEPLHVDRHVEARRADALLQRARASRHTDAQHRRAAGSVAATAACPPAARRRDPGGPAGARTRAPRRSTSGAPPDSARRSARATGSAWITSPSEDSLTRAIRRRRPSPGAGRHDGEPAKRSRMVRIRSRVAVRLRIARDGHTPARRAHGGALGHALLAVVGALGVHVRAQPCRSAPSARSSSKTTTASTAASAPTTPPAPPPASSGRPGALQPAHRGVRVERRRASTSPSARAASQVAHVAHVEEIEAAVGEDQPLALGAPGGRQARRPRQG